MMRIDAPEYGMVRSIFSRRGPASANPNDRMAGIRGADRPVSDGAVEYS